MEYTVAFTFSTSGDADTLSANLLLTGTNTISQAGNQPIQVQGIDAQTPSAALASLEFLQKSIAVQAATNTTDNPQYVKVVVPIKTSDSHLTGNFPFGSVPVRLQYRFIGTSSSGYINVGDFSIPFPG
ncbi:hypothetical protein G3N57_06230 [Paraburkholderia sp. Se-20369]|nr:hypothetical protein [Paraburkholderia sp. Se-20369]